MGRFALFAVTLLAAQAGVPRAGTWYTSSECGSRTYERRFYLRSDGIFVAEDRVAACLEGTVRGWCGLVTWAGRYRIEPDRVELNVERGPALLDSGISRPSIEHMLPEQDPAPKPIPDWPVPRFLKRDAATGAMSEQAPFGADCLYTSPGGNPLGR